MNLLKRFLSFVLTPPPVYVMVLTNLLIFSVLPVHGHLQKDTQACFKFKSTPKKLSEVLLPNGLLLEKYDTDGDKQDDFAVMSHVTEVTLNKKGEPITKHRERPLFFIKRASGELYIDKVGDGKCSDIVLYYDNNIAHEGNVMPQGGKPRGESI